MGHEMGKGCDRLGDEINTAKPSQGTGMEWLVLVVLVVKETPTELELDWRDELLLVSKPRQEAQSSLEGCPQHLDAQREHGGSGGSAEGLTHPPAALYPLC